MKHYLLAIAAVAAIALPVRAGELTWHYTADNSLSIPFVDATITTSDTLDGLNGYNITGVTGEIGGDAFTGVVPDSGHFQYYSTQIGETEFGFTSYDNVLYPIVAGSEPFDTDGWMFTTATDIWNLHGFTPTVGGPTDPGYAYDFISALATQGAAYPGLLLTDESLTQVLPDGGDTGSPTGVPEPASYALFGAGLAGFAAYKRRRKPRVR